MKNVGVALQNIEAFCALKELSLSGYPLEELRVLSVYDEAKLKETFLALSKEYDNIFIGTEKTELEKIKQAFLRVMPSAQIRSAVGSAIIFETSKNAFYLFSLDKSETGTGFIQNACVPFIREKFNLRFDKIVLRTVGANGILVERLLSETQRRSGNQIRCSRVRKYDEDVIEISYDGNTPKMLVDDVLRSFAEALGDTMYALNDTKLENQVVSLLKLRGKKLSVAESFTGGGIAKRIVSVSGASEVYFEGLNTYDELSKVKRLGVSAYTLKNMGAASERTAYEMTLGLLNTGDCDIAVATTGLAGPKSDRSELPVGLCFIGVGTKEKIFVYRYKFDGDREEITGKAINYALFLTYKCLKDV